MICHFCLLPPWTLLIPDGKKFIDIGWPCMESFFTLSGFLITGILHDSKGAENYFSLFYIRRALRILPVYYGTLSGIFILFPLFWKLGVPHLLHGFTYEPVGYFFYMANWATLYGERSNTWGTSGRLAWRSSFTSFGPVLSTSVRHPPQSGWLDEWGRLKGGHPLV